MIGHTPHRGQFFFAPGGAPGDRNGLHIQYARTAAGRKAVRL
jgi:hypothetical protein